MINSKIVSSGDDYKHSFIDAIYCHPSIMQIQTWPNFPQNRTSRCYNIIPQFGMGHFVLCVWFEGSNHHAVGRILSTCTNQQKLITRTQEPTSPGWGLDLGRQSCDWMVSICLPVSFDKCFSALPFVAIINHLFTDSWYLCCWSQLQSE